ncbi:MAG: hypothetical protein H7338_12215 [Candidatus Sericytochromatia bacterium]|nr:hypothetical protein [Candidatus Sericytochromatia bacterium]
MIDLDQPDDVLIGQIADILANVEQSVKAGRDAQLSFRLQRSGVDERQFTHTLSADAYQQAEQDVVFPLVVNEILLKEFPAKVAQNEQLRQHVIAELRQDPYWSSQVVELVKAMKAR